MKRSSPFLYILTILTLIILAATGGMTLYSYSSLSALQSQVSEMQKTAITNVVEKDSTLCIMPTGSGKSAVYWMAAAELNGICIVISPLTALIEEQVQKIESHGYETLKIHGGID